MGQKQTNRSPEKMMSYELLFFEAHSKVLFEGAVKELYLIIRCHFRGFIVKNLAVVSQFSAFV